MATSRVAVIETQRDFKLIARVRAADGNVQFCPVALFDLIVGGGCSYFAFVD